MEPPSPSAAEGGGAVPSADAATGPPAVVGQRRLRLLRRLDQLFHGVTGIAAATLLGFTVVLLAVLAEGAGPALGRYGPGFLSSSAWDGVHNVYGAWPAVAGTLLTSGLALLLAVPVALGVAIFLSEVAPPWLRAPLGHLVDLCAAVPSVVYGFWAFFVLVPVMRRSVEPDLASVTHGAFPFSGATNGLDLFTASVVLAVMILPTIAALSREALRAVPRANREAAMSLGATRWEATRIAVLGPARRGIVAGAVLGLGRAFGETIAVAMVIGNTYATPSSLFSPAQTLASLIVNNFTGVGVGLERSALFEIGLVLLLLTVGVNALARLLLRRPARANDRRSSHRPGRRIHRSESTPDGRAGSEAFPGALSQRWEAHLRDARPKNLPGRRWIERSFLLLCGLAVVVALLPLASVVATAVDRGGGAVVQPSFYVSANPLGCNPGPNRSCSLGGIGPQIQGTLIVLGLGAALAMPLGILGGIYLSEYGGRGRSAIARALSFLGDVLTGVPTILIGVVVFSAFLALDHDAATSALSGGVALGLVMLPIVARATEEALRTVPTAVRESATALGFTRQRTTLRVVLGSARSAVLTGALLGLSRAAGDTAALFVTAGSSLFWFEGLNSPVATLTPFIFDNFGSEYANLQADAWGAALVLLALMLAIGLAGRLLVRGRQPMGEL
ncbi:MAG TPA: phosphate ABC transporter permease subunit PstC [Thermoplasmata archaeon]|nr:phosphate ABC transporter permease subunit PstC [Thermoplasmata archaeon]